jgi:rhodanese-related sulfurtransferase
MISGWNNRLLVAAAIALSSCAPLPREKPARQENESAAQPEYQKPVRMNGRGKVSSISLEDFFLLQQSGKAVVFDARLALFYQLGHIPGAINLPKNRCDDAIWKRESEIKNAVAEGKTIVVYCSGMMCPDARAVAMHISGFGYPASVFSGGWDTWKEAGMPVE